MHLKTCIFIALFGCAWASEGHGKAGLLDVDPGLAFWTIITFVTLLLVLKKFAWKPLLEGLDAREKHIRDTITNAEQNRQEAEKYLDISKTKLQTADDEARVIVDKATQNALEIRQTQTVQTEKECTNIKVTAQKQITMLQTQALEELLGNVGMLGVEIAGKMIQKSLSEQDHDRIISESIANMQSQWKQN